MSPTTSRRWDVVSYERSRNVDEPMPALHELPMGITAPKIGKRAVIVLAELDPVVTRLNSGAYWRKSEAEPSVAREAGLIGLIASKSAVDPPFPSDRVLICPGGKPRPWVVSAPCAEALEAAK
jgi:hypothetical protein